MSRPNKKRIQFGFTSFYHEQRSKVVLTLLLIGSISEGRAADAYWKTDGTAGTWTGTNWSNPATAIGGTGWTTGDNAFFTANSTPTYVTGTGIGNINVANGVAVTVTAAGTLSSGSHVYDVGTGATLTWTGQSISNNSASSFTKSGAGIWNIGNQGVNNYTGGFTLNAGTVTVTGAKSFGTAAMAVNGGVIQSTGGISFAVTSMNVGGNFSFAGTGNDVWGATVDLGSAVRTITNNTTGTATRTFSNTISGSGGLAFTGVGGSGGIVLGGANTYTGDTKVNSGVVVLSNALALQNSALDTSGAGTISLASVTAPTLGGLKGSTNLASVITTGYSSVTGVTLNPGTGVTDTYSGTIANGAAGMNLSKTGAGTQIFTGANTYTGTTSITGGTLEIAEGSGALSGTNGVGINGGTLLLSRSGATDAMINNSATVNLGNSAGTSKLQLSGSITESFGALTLSGTSGVGIRVIDFGGSNSVITFPTISSQTSDLPLQVWNWTGLGQFNVTSGILGANLAFSDITFYSGEGSGLLGIATFSGNSLVPVPEVGALFGALCLIAPLAYRERRHWMRCREARMT